MSESKWPQAGRERLIVPAPVGVTGTGMENPEDALMSQLDERHVMMMGDNPALPRMPAKPTLMDYFKLRLKGVTPRHLLVSAGRALDAGHSEKVVLACLLHDISNGVLVRTDHGYWGAQMIAPYVDEEIAWAVRYHQALRYFADESVGYAYPESYHRFFGSDYVPPDYICRDAEYARGHRWYMSSRLITLYDIYFFQDSTVPEVERFADIIGRHFRQPEEGLGLDDSPSAHMWRTVIWPNNFL
jgi:HD domain